MARSRATKNGLEYFSHDVDITQDIKIKILKAKFGLVGYAVYMRLLEEIYKDKGYYIQLDDDFNILFCDDNRIDYDEYILILNECIEKELFSKEMHEKYNILTSKRIQLNYLAGTERRKGIEIVAEYMLLPSETTTKNNNVNIITLNVDNLTLNDNISVQSKVKESNNTSLTFCEKVFDYYLTKDNLIRHTSLNKDIEKSINLAMKQYCVGYTETEKIRFCKMIIDNHSRKVELTKNKGQFATKVRPIAELFGQKAFRSNVLIVNEYLDENFNKWLEENNLNSDCRIVVEKSSEGKLFEEL